MSVPLPRSSAAIPVWQSDPYRIFFPLGVLLAWAGVLHWFLLAIGLAGEYRAIFHAFAQIRSFHDLLRRRVPLHPDPTPHGDGACLAAWQMVLGPAVARS